MRKDVTRQRSIHPLGVLFAIALTLILVTLADLAVRQFGTAVTLSATIRMVAPFVAGILTTLYVGDRGGIHAFLGGLISIPLLALFVLPGTWGVSLLTGILCAMGGAITEFLRSRS